MRKPSSAINAKKERKTIEWERLEITSRKLDITREYFMKDGHNKLDETVVTRPLAMYGKVCGRGSMLWSYDRFAF